MEVKKFSTVYWSPPGNLTRASYGLSNACSERGQRNLSIKDTFREIAIELPFH